MHFHLVFEYDGCFNCKTSQPLEYDTGFPNQCGHANHPNFSLFSFPVCLARAVFSRTPVQKAQSQKPFLRYIHASKTYLGNTRQLDINRLRQFDFKPLVSKFSRKKCIDLKNFFYQIVCFLIIFQATRGPVYMHLKRTFFNFIHSIRTRDFQKLSVPRQSKGEI